MIEDSRRKSPTACFKCKEFSGVLRSPEERMRDKQLRTILDALREKHKPIADMFANDAGINLMHQDAQITENIIKHFTDNEIPILTIHDSYIVPFGLENELMSEMEKAFASVTGRRFSSPVYSMASTQ